MLNDSSFWYFIAFVIFTSLAFRPAARAISAVLDDRSRRIGAELEEAQRLRRDAEQALNDCKRRHEDAVRESQEIVQRAHDEALRIQARGTEDLRELVERKGKQAHETIKRLEQAALIEMRDKTIDIALTTTKNMLGRALDEDAGSRLIDQAIRELSLQFEEKAPSHPTAVM